MIRRNTCSCLDVNWYLLGRHELVHQVTAALDSRIVQAAPATLVQLFDRAEVILLQEDVKRLCLLALLGYQPEKGSIARAQERINSKGNTSCM